MAGLTAARTAARMPASIVSILNIILPKIIMPSISIEAGTKLNKIAGLPTFLSLSKFRESPARLSIVTRAICLKSLLMFTILSLTKPN